MVYKFDVIDRKLYLYVMDKIIRYMSIGETECMFETTNSYPDKIFYLLKDQGFTCNFLHLKDSTIYKISWK